MVIELQYVAIAAFLLWCLACSLCSRPDPDQGEAARLVWREHGPAGWGRWRKVHFGLTGADRRVLSRPEPVLDGAAYAALIDAVREQCRRPESDAIQFAVVRATPDQNQATVVFLSGRMPVETSVVW